MFSEFHVNFTLAACCSSLVKYTRTRAVRCKPGIDTDTTTAFQASSPGKRGNAASNSQLYCVVAALHEERRDMMRSRTDVVALYSFVVNQGVAEVCAL